MEQVLELAIRLVSCLTILGLGVGIAVWVVRSMDNKD